MLMLQTMCLVPFYSGYFSFGFGLHPQFFINDGVMEAIYQKIFVTFNSSELVSGTLDLFGNIFPICNLTCIYRIVQNVLYCSACKIPTHVFWSSFCTRGHLGNLQSCPIPYLHIHISDK